MRTSGRRVGGQGLVDFGGESGEVARPLDRVTVSMMLENLKDHRQLPQRVSMCGVPLLAGPSGKALYSTTAARR